MAGRSKTPSLDGRPALTPKQHEFCAEFCRNGNNAVQAYIHAYDCENTSYKVARNEASLLLGNHDVAMAIAHMQADQRDLTKLSVKEYLDGLETLEKQAIEQGATGAAVRAKELQGKVLGLYVDRIQNEAPNVAEILENLREALGEQVYQALRSQLGLDITHNADKTTH